MAFQDASTERNKDVNNLNDSRKLAHKITKIISMLYIDIYTGHIREKQCWSSKAREIESNDNNNYTVYESKSTQGELR